jgi:hypothetical protein
MSLQMFSEIYPTHSDFHPKSRRKLVWMRSFRPCHHDLQKETDPSIRTDRAWGRVIFFLMDMRHFAKTSIISLGSISTGMHCFNRDVSQSQHEIDDTAHPRKLESVVSGYAMQQQP